MSASRVIHRRASAGRDWWVATGPPAEPLRQYIRRYQGYYEAVDGVARRRHSPNGDIPIIFAMSAPMHLAPLDGTASPLAEHRFFAAGPTDTYGYSETQGISHGLQVDLSPIGAYLFFGVALDSFANQAVEIEDLLGAEGRELVERLHVKTNAEAFDALDRAFTARIARAKPASPAVVWAWQRIVATHGAASIGSLAERIGWSRKHLIARFREQIGLAPKTYARIIRFNRALALLEAMETPCWTEVALRSGYYDQSHLIRDFVQFSGSTPTDYVARQLPGGGMEGS